MNVDWQALNAEIKPCPFCGDRYPDLRGQSAGCWVQCTVVQCGAAGGCDTAASAIARWKQRADRSATHERAAVVAWLQAVEDDGQGSTWQWAETIARGEHVK